MEYLRMRTSISFRIARMHRMFLRIAGCAVLLPGLALSARAQDASALKPPASARIAIVEFDDLECPACAHANPILKEAAAQYKIPWIRHDFLIPGHVWSRTAAVNARWFDSKGSGLGDTYRDYLFDQQRNIETLDQLNQYTQRFVQYHHIAWPMMGVDPQGKLLAEVNADIELGKRIGISLTPSIFIVTAGTKGTSSTQVKDPDHDLYSTIDRAVASTRH